jgi:hypothetical protein
MTRTLIEILAGLAILANVVVTAIEESARANVGLPADSRPYGVYLPRPA